MKRRGLNRDDQASGLIDYESRSSLKLFSKHGSPTGYRGHFGLCWPRAGPTERNQRKMTLRKTLSRYRHKMIAKLKGVPNEHLLRTNGITLGKGVYLGPGCHIDGAFAWLISIGDHSAIAPYTTILAHDASMKLATGYTRCAPVRIGSNVFIGSNVTVLCGTTIGDGSIIGAGSLVRGNVPPGRIYAGNPARDIGSAQEYLAKQQALVNGFLERATERNIDHALLQSSNPKIIRALMSDDGYVH